MFPIHAHSILWRGAALAAAVALALGLGRGHAALDFDSYRIIQHKTRVTHAGATSDSTWTTYELARLGSTSLEASSLTLTSHGSYLSVVEEATLPGDVEDRPHATSPGISSSRGASPFRPWPRSIP